MKIPLQITIVLFAVIILFGSAAKGLQAENCEDESRMGGNAMKVTRKVLIPIDDRSQETVDKSYYGVAIMSVNTAYTGRSGRGLIQQYTELVGSDTFGKYYQRASEDNGKTWSEPVAIYKTVRTDEGVLRWGESCLFRDEDKNAAIIQFYNYHIYPGDHFTGDVGKYTKVFMRISRDGGKTFAEPEQLIQKGFDEKNWADGVIYGQNSIAVSFCAPVKTSDGRILLPVQRSPLGSNFGNAYYINEEAGCFIGVWNGDKLEWDLSQMAKIDPKLSSRGVCEPTIAELSDGSFLMVMRGSNASINHVPGYRWYSVSQDSGRSWSEPSPMLYDTGENFFSPATGSRLIRSSADKKLYWIGNISKENTNGNSPRYPLLIAEVDEAKKAIRKDTVHEVEYRRENDPPSVQFSNFRAYEDRETHEIVVLMARILERGGNDLSSPSYEYRINVLAK